MAAVLRHTLYFVGDPSVQTRAHVTFADGSEFDIVSESPYYPAVSWRVDLDTVVEDIRLRVVAANAKYVAAGLEPAPLWVTTNIVVGAHATLAVGCSHGKQRAIWLSPVIKSVDIL